MVSLMENDQQFEAFVEAYPAARRQRGYMAETLFLHALSKVSYETLIQALEQHKRSQQWASGMIPSLRVWLEEERWIQVLPETPASADDADRIRKRQTPWQHAKRLGLK